jgi:hypothetical protein
MWAGTEVPDQTPRKPALGRRVAISPLAERCRSVGRSTLDDSVVEACRFASRAENVFGRSSLTDFRSSFFFREDHPMSRASVYSIRSGNRRLPNQAGKVLCVLITLAFGTSLAQALHSGAAFVGGLKLVYSSGDGDLCGISQVPEIDPATGGSAPVARRRGARDDREPASACHVLRLIEQPCRSLIHSRAGHRRVPGPASLCGIAGPREREPWIRRADWLRISGEGRHASMPSAAN